MQTEPTKEKSVDLTHYADLAYYSDDVYANLFPVIEVFHNGRNEVYPVGHLARQPAGEFSGSLEVLFQPRQTWYPPTLVAVYRNWDAYFYVRG